jgi:hypothetical protein
MVILGCGASNSQDAGPSKQKVARKQASQVASETASEKTATNDPQPAPTVDPADVVVVSFEELAQAHREDYSLRKFGPKRIESTIVVSAFECSRGLAGKGTRDAVLCQVGLVVPTRLLINPKTPQPWASVSMDQEVTLRSSPVGSDEPYWDIQIAGLNQAPMLNASDLAAQFHKEEILALQKYDSRPVYVTGQVMQVQREGLFHTITLHGSDSMNIKVLCESNPLTEAIKSRQTIHVLGRVRRDTLSNDPTSPVILYQAIPITVPFPVPSVKYVESIDARIQNLIAHTRQSKSAVTLTAEAYKSQDEPTLLKKYAGKLVEVSGSITRFASYDKGDAIAILPSDGANQINVVLIEPEPWKNHVNGQQVTVRGRMDHGTASGLHDAVIMHGEPQAEPLKLFSTAELVDAYSGDRENFIAQWTDRPMEVVGVLKSIDLNQGIFELTEDGAIPIVAKLPDAPAHRFRFGKHKIGDRVQVMTVIDALDSSFEVLRLNNAWDRIIKPTVDKSEN